MKTETLAEVLALLQGKFEMNGQQMTDAAEGLYEIALAPLDDHWGEEAVKLLLVRNKWAPDISEILDKAAELASPAPTPEEAAAEVFAQMGRYDPKPLSHTLVQEAAEDMGGLDTLWHQHAYGNTPISVQRRDFIALYNRRLIAWRGCVIEELYKPESKRDCALFPGWTPTPIAIAPSTAKALPAFQEEDVPDFIAEVAQKIGRPMPVEIPRETVMDSAKRREIEEEVRSHRMRERGSDE